MMKTSLKFSERQRGAVLLVGLVMLVMVTLLAISGFNMVKVNQQVAGNMESRGQAMVAANAAIEEAISSVLFFNQPRNIFLNSCGANNTKCYDMNGDGVDDITVTVAEPSCVVVLPVKINDLDFLDPQDFGCVADVTQTSGDSLCVDSLWDLRAVAEDNVTGAQATVRQGVSVRVSKDNIASTCPDPEE